MVKSMVAQRVLDVRQTRNVIALNTAVVRYSDYGDADAYLQQLFAKIAEAGLGNVANEITWVLACKYANSVIAAAVVAPEEDAGESCDEVPAPVRPPPKRRRQNATFDIEEREVSARPRTRSRN